VDLELDDEKIVGITLTHLVKENPNAITILEIEANLKPRQEGRCF